MRKYDLISALSEETAREVARNDGSWKKYLNIDQGFTNILSKTSLSFMPKDQIRQLVLP